MLLKYLRALLARFVSKNETEFISTQSTPSRNGIDLDIPTNNELSYTAPSNGFLNIADEMSNGKMGITSWGVMDSTVYSESSASGGQDAVYIPMKKGDTQHVIIYGKARFIRFVKMMGGSLALVLGGGLCLSHFLERSAKRLLAMLSQVEQKLQLVSLVVLGGKVSPLQMMVTLLSTQLAQRQQSKLVDDVEQQPSKHTTVFHVCLSQLAKASLLFTTLKERQHRKAKRISSLQSLPFNLSLGGAL